MTKRKPKVLWVGEASFLNSGFAIYGKEVLSRLWKTGKYEIAELGIYGHWNDNRRFELPWRWYGNLPDTHDHDSQYYGDNLNQFGAWKFDEVCIDFHPDVVIDVRDWWMSEFEQRSPFRKFFHWAIMPTIDSIPHKDQWIETYKNANSVFTYSEFGRDYLQSHGINVLNVASPAVDYNIFKPVSDKDEHRRKSGFMDNIFIVGTVMRNQRRKLYPDLITSFKTFLEKNPDLGKKTYLYLHTSYPDNGWDIPGLVRTAGLGHKVLFTYMCTKCRYITPSFFQGANQICRRCHNNTLQLPNVHTGITREELAGVYNWFDLYIQYSIAEGFGIPMVEAAACGIPFAAVDYSAMSSVVHNLKATPIRVAKMFHESESGHSRALPDDDHLVEIISKFLNQPESMRKKKSRDTYIAVRKNYQWDRTAMMWENMLDNVELRDHKTTWDSPPNIIPPNPNLPERLNNEELVKYLIGAVLREPEKIHSYMALRLLRDLNHGQKVVGAGGFFHNEDSLQPRNRYSRFTQKDALDEILKMLKHKNNWEQKRVNGTGDCPLYMHHVKEANV